MIASKKTKHGPCVHQVIRALSVCFLLSCSHGQSPDQHHELESFTEVRTMMTTPTDPRTAALNRVAQHMQAPVGELAVKPWESSLLELERSVWAVHNMEMSPSMDCLIAVDGKGRTFWINHPDDMEELLRFMYAEGLVERFAHTPERLIEVLLHFRDNNNRERLLRSLDDIEQKIFYREWPKEVVETERKMERQRIATLRDQFYPPRAIPGHPLKLDFWTWSPLGGVVARWHVELGDGAGEIIYDEVMDEVGNYFRLA